jgi:hypothetical protein
MRLIGKAGPWVVLAVLSTLLRAYNLTWLLGAGVILTTVSTLTMWIMLDVRQRTNVMFDIGDYKTNRSVDVTSENREPPPVLRPGILALNDLGFRRLGEEITVTADGRELGTEWVFVNEDGQILASILPSRTAVGGLRGGFQTIFPDYAYLLTYFPSGFPMGETISLPDFRFRHTRQSLQEAYKLHCNELPDFAQQHVRPVQHHNMADYLAFAPILRQRYTGIILRRGLLVKKLQQYLALGATLLFLIGTLLSNIVPAAAILIFVLGFSSVRLYYSYMTPAPPRAGQLFRVAIALALLLLPLCFVWHGFVLIHNFLLVVLLSIFNRFVPANAKAFAKEIEAGKTDISLQVDGPDLSKKK